jgi:secreted trypsin-like serine protease
MKSDQFGIINFDSDCYIYGMSPVLRKAPRIQVFALLLGLLAPLSVATPAAAIYGGKPSIDNPFVVGLLNSEFAETAGCSGALVAPRIVMTAAHCLTMPAQNFWIQTPGTNLADKGLKRVRGEKLLIPSGFTSAKFPYDNDFGVLILSAELPFKTSITIATESQVTEWIKQESSVLHVGYGCTELVDAPPCRKTSPTANEFETQLLSQVPQQFTSLTPNSFSMTKISVDKTICGGDSGSPLLKKAGDKWFYIGAQSSSNGAGCTKTCNIQCVATQGLAFYNTNLVTEALKFVEAKLPETTATPTPTATPVVTAKPSPVPLQKKTTITCIKGKTIKKVTAVSPKCPTGYKKK